MTEPLLYLAEDGDGEIALWADHGDGWDVHVADRRRMHPRAWALIEEALVARLRPAQSDAWHRAALASAAHARSEVAAIRTHVDAAKAEIARLTAGAAPDPAPEHVEHTPEQAWRFLLDATTERRLEALEDLLDAARAGWACTWGILGGHVEQIARLTAERDGLVRHMRAAEDREAARLVAEDVARERAAMRDRLVARANSYDGTADRLSDNGFGADASCLRTVAAELRQVARELA